MTPEELNKLREKQIAANKNRNRKDLNCLLERLAIGGYGGVILSPYKVSTEDEQYLINQGFTVTKCRSMFLFEKYKVVWNEKLPITTYGFDGGGCF